MVKHILPEVVTDPVETAKAVHLRYVSDDDPGITRERKGKDFIYLDTEGNKITDKTELKRIRLIGIPPAWTDVWICPTSNGHIQATGRDAKGRKQYRYHTRWREQRSETKFTRMLAFGEALPKIRERVEKDLRRAGMPREKVLAIVVRLLESTLIRVGNEEYTRNNDSYGLTTMKDKHVKVDGKEVHFKFKGKSGIKHDISLEDKQLAALVKKSRDIPGYHLFQYFNENDEPVAIGSSDVNDYVREISGSDFTAKDFRTWGGTVLAVRALCSTGDEISAEEALKHVKKDIVEAIKSVAGQLGNTPTICRKYYVHPVVLEAYEQGSLGDVLKQRSTGKRTQGDLHPEEQVVMHLLREQVKQTK